MRCVVIAAKLPLIYRCLDLSFVLGEVMISHWEYNRCFSVRPDPYSVCYCMEYRFNPAESRLQCGEVPSVTP